MCGAIPVFPHTHSWHLIKLGDHRAFKVQFFFRVPYNCRQQYSKQILLADQNIFCETLFSRLWIGGLWCFVVSCSLVAMHSFGWTYSLLLQSASYVGSIFFRIFGVYQITRRHTQKDTILASHTLKDLYSTLQESQNLFRPFRGLFVVPRPNMFWNASNVNLLAPELFFKF